jgi:predicted nucleic acid-binding Zn ribbon protein
VSLSSHTAKKKRKKEKEAWHSGFTSIILATQEADIRRITVQRQSRQIVYKTLSWKYLTQERAGGVAQVVEHLCSKCEALSSNSSTKRERKKTLLMIIYQILIIYYMVVLTEDVWDLFYLLLLLIISIFDFGRDYILLLY